MHKVALATSESVLKKTNSAGNERRIIGTVSLASTLVVLYDLGAPTGVYRLGNRSIERAQSLSPKNAWQSSCCPGMLRFS